MRKKFLFILIIFITLPFVPGKNKEEKEVCFETLKLAYNSFKKISYIPKIALMMHIIKPIKKGLWSVHPNINLIQLYNLTNKTDPINFETYITIPSGITKFQILKLINENPNLSGAKIEDIDEGEFCAQTYHFKKGTQRKTIVAIAKKQMDDLTNKLWEAKKNNTSLTKNEWIILASIVEREGKTKEDFIKIASCFLTRLKKNMYLGSCPTVLYGLNKPGKTRTYFKDLKKNTPFNTYKNKGLPPKSICIPSKNALEAVLEANNNSPYLYFYYDDKLIMSKTFNQHIKTKNKHKKKK